MKVADMLKAFTDNANKKHGKTIGLASNMKPKVMPRLSTGSLSLDFALGGGVPTGCLIEMFGKKSSAKTTTALRVIALAQKLCANCLRPAKNLEVVEVGVDQESGEAEYEMQGYCDCYKEGIFKPVPYFIEYSDREKGTFRQVEVAEVDDKGSKKNRKTTAYKERIRGYEENSYEPFRVAFFDVEHTIDLKWAKQIGVDTRVLWLAKPSTAEQCIDLYDSLMKTGGIHLFVLDSVASMVPTVEVESSTHDEQMASQAKLITKFVRKVIGGASDCYKDFGHAPTQIWLNQVRDSFKPFEPYVIPGGSAKKFGASVGLFMWSSKGEKAVVGGALKKENQSEIASDVKVNFKVEYNKTAPPLATGRFVVKVLGLNSGKVQEFKYVYDQATRYGLIRTEGEGAKKRWFVGDLEFDRKASALAKIEEPEVFNLLKEKLLKLMWDDINSSE